MHSSPTSCKDSYGQTIGMGVLGKVKFIFPFYYNRISQKTKVMNIYHTVGQTCHQLIHFTPIIFISLVGLLLSMLKAVQDKLTAVLKTAILLYQTLV